MYTKKDKFATKIAYVQDKILPQPQKLYTGMSVTPVTNSMSGCNGGAKRDVASLWSKGQLPLHPARSRQDIVYFALSKVDPSWGLGL